MYLKAMPAGSAGIMGTSYGMEAVLKHEDYKETVEEPTEELSEEEEIGE